MITIQAGYALVIDDEPANRDFLVRLLQTANFKVIGAGTGADGLKAAQGVPELALALVDQELPDSSGLEVIAQLRAANPETLIVMATMHDDRALINKAFMAGIDVFLVKPHGFMELYRRLKEVDSDTTLLRRLIIDQYGPRLYKGQDWRQVSAINSICPEPPQPPKVETALPPVVSAPASTIPAPSAPPAATPPVTPSTTQPAIGSHSDVTLLRRPASTSYLTIIAGH